MIGGYVPFGKGSSDGVTSSELCLRKSSAVCSREQPAETQPTDSDKISTHCMSDKGLILRIYKKLA